MRLRAPSPAPSVPLPGSWHEWWWYPASLLTSSWYQCHPRKQPAEERQFSSLLSPMVFLAQSCQWERHLVCFSNTTYTCVHLHHLQLHIGCRLYDVVSFLDHRLQSGNETITHAKHALQMVETSATLVALTVVSSPDPPSTLHFTLCRRVWERDYPHSYSS